MNAESAEAAFIRAHTTLAGLVLVPEIQLHLANDVMRLWRETELRAAKIVGSGALSPPYWAFAWPGGQALARYILDHRAAFAGKAVLDIGSGSGIVAIAAAKTGAAPVVAADIDSLALAAIALNAAANRVYVEPVGNDLIGEEGRWAAVFAGDMCYERPLAERLVAWLRQRARHATRVLIGDPGRSYVLRTGLERLATYDVPTSRDLEDRDSRETSVYELLA